MNISIQVTRQALAYPLALMLESCHEDWRCQRSLTQCQLLLTDDDALIKRLQGYPLILWLGEAHPLADACAACPEELPRLIETIQFAIPRRYPLAKGCAIAEAFLTDLGLSPQLKGFTCLRWLIAAVLANPALMERVTTHLYPLAAQALGMSAAGVEKCVRHAIENLWSHGDLNVLEKWFGQSVDPERGKPTNREFLAMASVHCTLARQAKTC